MAKRKQGAKFVQYFAPLLDALRELGGSATPSEATDKVADLCNVSEEQQNELTESGTARFRNRVAWARFYLRREGFLDSSKRGIWSLTEKGWKAHLSGDEADQIFKRGLRMDAAARKQREKGKDAEQTASPDEIDISASPTCHERLLDMILSLPLAGFERLCQRLLREAGFQQVEVTGRSGDDGIDGHGILEVNPFVTFKVLFQCKRWKGNVGAPEIRAFQGAMAGRADKGIVLTTSGFTLAAKREARRDGAPPVELVDGEKLVEMFEKHELGVAPRTIYDVDNRFFDEFRD